MDHDWIVEVKDDTGAALTTAKVAFVQTSALAGKEWPFSAVAATHDHKGAGKYELKAPLTPVAGAWTLIVLVDKKSPVIQPLKMTEKSKTEMLTSPSPLTAATVAFSSEIKTIGGSKVRRARFGVTMFKSSECVFISGTEYFGAGTRFRIFAENHAIALVREKKVDDGVIITLFSTDDRARDTLVPASGGKLLKVASKSFGSTAGITPGKKHDPVVGSDVSVIDMYKYLSDVGGAEPGRVKEVGFFSHSWPGGPILYNTGDNSSLPARLPDDFDARRKDFNATNVTKWPNMKAAMASSGRWYVWGCSATTHHKNLVIGARNHKKDGDHKHFTVNTSVTHHGGAVAETVEEHTTRARIRFEMDRRFRSEAFMAVAAKHLGIAVLGAPPGVGSSFANPKTPGHPALSVMFIDMKEWAPVYAYFKDEFGPEFEPTDTAFDKGYVDYKRLGGRAAPPAAPFASEFYQLSKDMDGKETTLAFANGRGMRLAGVAYKLVVTPKTGFAVAGKKGHQYELIEPADASKSNAVFVQEDARIFRVNKDASGKFTVLGPEL